MYQVLIGSKLVINKGKKGANLLIEYPLLYSEKSLWPQIGKLKPRGQPYKIPIAKSSKEDKAGKKTCTKCVATKDGNVDKLAHTITKWMRTNPSLDPIPKRDLSRISGKNPLVEDRLVSLAYYKVAKSTTETSSKVREPKTYNEAINNRIHSNRWCRTIDKELWNLDTHQT